MLVLSVLYVEDNRVDVRLVRRVLARRGTVRLSVASTGEMALRLAAAARPDLVLLDLMLPDLPGEVVLERLWQLDGLAGTPGVVVSAIARLRRRGVSDYLTKPLDVAVLYACVDAVGVLTPARDALC